MIQRDQTRFRERSGAFVFTEFVIGFCTVLSSFVISVGYGFELKV